MAISARGKIDGRHHPLIKKVRGMARGNDLHSGGVVLLETTRLLEDAIRSAVPITDVLVSAGTAHRFRDLIERLPPETRIHEIAPSIFDSLVSTETPQGILALAAAPHWTEQDVFSPSVPLVVVIAALQDPGNLGTILRTCDAFGATGVLLTRGTVSPYNPKAVRASAGSWYRVPLLRDLHVREIVEAMERHRVRLFASVSSGGTAMDQVDLRSPLALAIGSEAAGLPQELTAAGDPLTIPVSSTVESLNAAAAAAVMLYEIRRQRGTA